ncbi:MAG: EamA family transporter RarD [Ardenticatenaceae bacterium]|nr:EamA family transporter RarD [Ardenticatenaceae bacterium]
MRNKGFHFAAAAYTMWGFFPIYWKLLHSVPALEILAHRMVWSLGFVVLVLAYKRRWGWLKPALRSKRILLTFLATGTVLSLNWFVYIWGVNAGFIVETSLGYFINPLVNVLLGVIFLGERMRAGQWTAVSLAAVGVLYLTILYGSLPWIALTLAFSFGTYGLLRKTAPLEALEGLGLETAVMFIPALAYLIYLQVTGQAAFGHSGWTTSLMLAFAGVITAVPLWFFAIGARQVTLITLGLLQYIAPTLQFLIGVFVYHEPFSRTQMVGFGLIWLALLLYSAEGILTARKKRQLGVVG